MIAYLHVLRHRPLGALLLAAGSGIAPAFAQDTPEPTPEAAEVEAADGLLLKGDLYRPETIPEEGARTLLLIFAGIFAVPEGAEDPVAEMMVMILGYATLALLVATVVIGISSVYLEHKRLRGGTFGFEKQSLCPSFGIRRANSGHRQKG